jgi:hypothetical protein
VETIAHAPDDLMARRRKWWYRLQASKQEALLAVDLYNRAGETRSLEAFIVHMQIAWLYLLQARFDRDKVDYWHRDDNGKRVKGPGGDYQSWSLRKSVANQWPDESDPVRLNIEFFAGLRDRIEHRYERDLDPVIAGKCQACVLNYEATLVELFGESEGLADQLRFPVFLSSLNSDAVDALKRAYMRLPKKLTKYIEDSDLAAGDSIRNDLRFQFRVFLVPSTSSKSTADVAMRFVRFDELTDEQRNQFEIVQTIVREKQVPVQNIGKLKATAVAERVRDALGCLFSVGSDHVKCWKHFKVRPVWPAPDNHPERTDAAYCVFDELHNDYVYTDAWVDKLVRELSDSDQFEAILGHAPVAL